MNRFFYIIKICIALKNIIRIITLSQYITVNNG